VLDRLSGRKIAVPVLTFTDPDDRATSSGIDPNGSEGNDNAPIENDGKRAGGIVMWKETANTPAFVDPGGQSILAYISLAPGETGAIQVQFLASAIAGDNYRLKAQAMSVSTGSRVLKEATSGLLEVFKEITFERVLQMTGGADVTTIMSAARVAPAFEDANTVSQPAGREGAAAGTSIARLSAPISRPIRTGSTQQELDQFASQDPVLKGVAKGSFRGRR
jgi:hypothetical protein